jgi:hypothetical protein
VIRTTRRHERLLRNPSRSNRSGQVRFITRPKSRTMRLGVTRQLMSTASEHRHLKSSYARTVRASASLARCVPVSEGRQRRGGPLAATATGSVSVRLQVPSYLPVESNFLKLFAGAGNDLFWVPAVHTARPGTNHDALTSCFCLSQTSRRSPPFRASSKIKTRKPTRVLSDVAPL